MSDQFSRIQLLIGKKSLDSLAAAKVAIFGIGGVGGYVAEALARSGVGSFVLVDNDTVCLSNLNRQIIATHKTIGQYKVDVMRDRILDINPDAQVEVRKCFYLPENTHEFNFSEYSYVVDAVDTVTAKMEIILQAQKCGTPVISSMGAGNKLDPTKFQVADIYKTSMCPLAKVMRHECKKHGVKKLKVVYSTEAPISPIEDEDANSRLTNGCSVDNGATTGNGTTSSGNDISASNDTSLGNGCSTNTESVHAGRRSTPGSIAFVPSVAGLILAGEVVKDLIRG